MQCIIKILVPIDAIDDIEARKITIEYLKSKGLRLDMASLSEIQDKKPPRGIPIEI